MKVIQCDKCKKIIETGKRVRFDHGNIRPPIENDNEEFNRYSKLTTRDLDLCDECYEKLKEFLGVKE